MGKRVVTSIRVEKDVLRTAKELGLNVSKVSEKALKESIRRLQTPVQRTESNRGRLRCEAHPDQPNVAGPLGFEPRISGSAGQRLNPY